MPFVGLETRRADWSPGMFVQMPSQPETFSVPDGILPLHDAISATLAVLRLRIEDMLMHTFLRKYGTQSTIDFSLYDITGVDLKVDAVYAAGDVKVMLDEGAEANSTNGFVDEGQGYSIVLTAAELTAARVVVYVVDQATKVWLDTAVVIETFGHASAMYPFDLSVATQNVNVTSIANGVIAAATFAANALDAVWSTAARLLTAGTNIVLAKGVGVTGFNDLSAAQVNTEADTALADYGALKPTDAGRTLDVSVGGEAGLDWANIGTPNTIQNLSNTNIDSDQVVASVTGNVGGDVVGAVKLSSAGRQALFDQQMSLMTTAGSFGKLIADFIDAAISSRLASAGYTAPSNASIALILTIAQKLDTALELDGAVYRYTVNALELAPSGGSAPTAAENADAVWDELIAGHLGAGSTGAKLNSASAAGDPWATDLPGAYAGADAGNVLWQAYQKALLISANNFTITSPVSPVSGRLTLNQSQDYLLADGGVLPSWQNDDWIPFSLLTAASVAWYAKTKYNSTVASGVVHVITNDELDIRTFANAVTRLLMPGTDEYRLQVWAVLDVAHGSAQKLLVNAPMSIVDDIRT